MGFSQGFEKVAGPLGAIARGLGSLAGRAVKPVASSAVNLAGKGVGAGLKGVGFATTGTFKPMGLVGATMAGSQFLSNVKDNTALMQGSIQR